MRVFLPSGRFLIVWHFRELYASRTGPLSISLVRKSRTVESTFRSPCLSSRIRTESHGREIQPCASLMNTESKIREDALHAFRASQGERRLNRDPALDAILVMDGRGCITEWNPQATELFG